MHAALAEHERALNADVEHPLMRELELPYPLLVGRVDAGEWSSSVPDRLRVRGPRAVRVGEDARRPRAPRSRRPSPRRSPTAGVELRWAGGQFASGRDAAGPPVRDAVRAALSAELGREARARRRARGAPTCACSPRAGIPTVMAGTPGIELAHAVDERVRVDELVTLARTIVRVAMQFAA